MFVRLNNITINCMLAALLSALFASCTNEIEDEADPLSGKNEKGTISFSTYTGGATRAADVTALVLQGKEPGRTGGFQVSAWYNNQPFFQDSCRFQNGLAVDNSSIIANAFDTKNSTYYWPLVINSSKKVAFRAFNNLKKVQDGNPIWTGDNKDKIKYDLYWYASDQEDLVVAYSEATVKPENGVQPLNFIHALSKINFSFTGADAEYKYTVNRVEVIAAGKGGPTMSFTTTTDNATPSTQAEKITWKFTAIDGSAALVVADKSTPANGGTAAQGILYTYHKEDSDSSGENKNIGLVVNGMETKDMDDNLMLLPQNGMVAIRVYYKVEDPSTGELIGNCGYYRTDTNGNHDVKMTNGILDANNGHNAFNQSDPGVWGCKTLIVNLGEVIKDEHDNPLGWQAGKAYRFVITLPTDNFKGDISGDGVADDLYEGKDLDGDGDGEESEFGMDEGYIEFSVSVKPWVDENYNANIVIK